MKISVITVCWNAAHCIERAIRSVAAQTYADIEYIIIDGGSTDATLNILQTWRDHIDVLVSEPDGGIYDAMNKGIRKSQGDAIFFLNSDDFFYSSCAVELMVDYMRRHPKADVVYGGIEVRMAGVHPHVFMPPPAEEALQFLVSGSLPHQATFARRGAFARTGLFDTRYRSHADYDWFLKAATHPEIVMAMAPVVVASFLLGGASSQLERGERERHSIQNAVPAYQTDAWLKRRIEIYQELYLSLRLEVERLRPKLAGPLAEELAMDTAELMESLH
jgi:glycosyltransferase involved in cell wall biosynthesis